MRYVLLLILFLTIAIQAIAPRKVFAATFTVDSTTDVVDDTPGDGVCATSGVVCTLRAAIQETNSLAGTDTITVPAGTYTLTIAPSGSNTISTGDLNITGNVTINGNSSATTIIDANQIDRVMRTTGAITVALSGLTIKKGSTTSEGGGLQNFSGTITLTEVIFSSNQGTTGGGLYNSGTATLTNVMAISNIATGSSSSYGGGIENDGALTATNLTVTSNHALTTTGTSNGGGISHYGSALTLTNATVNNNTASYTTGSGANGGGMFFRGNATITNSTIANNLASGTNADGGGILLQGGVTVQLKNVILSDNHQNALNKNCSGASGYITSNGNNLSSDSSCNAEFISSGDLNSTNPLLDSLNDNGGSVYTMALLTGSPAIDAGTNTGCTSTDAHSTSRPQDGDTNGTATCDIGAFEYVFSPTPTPTSGPPRSYPSSCNDQKPTNSPELFQIYTTNTTAKLRFRPINDPVNNYAVEYGLKEGMALYAIQFNQGYSAGAIDYVVNQLKPKTIYYFRVRGGNSCAPGDWSNWLGARTTANKLQKAVFNLYPIKPKSLIQKLLGR